MMNTSQLMMPRCRSFAGGVLCSPAAWHQRSCGCHFQQCELVPGSVPSCSQHQLHVGMCVPCFCNVCAGFLYVCRHRAPVLLAVFDLLAITALLGGRRVFSPFGREIEEAQGDFKSFCHIHVEAHWGTFFQAPYLWALGALWVARPHVVGLWQATRVCKDRGGNLPCWCVCELVRNQGRAED